jgi:membrane-associated phospholipid phosphatase
MVPSVSKIPYGRRLTLAVMAAVLVIGSSAQADDSNGLPAPEPRTTRLFHRSDLGYGLGMLGLTLVAMHNDTWLTHESTEADSRGERRLARAAQPLGNLGIVGPTIAVGYLAARLGNRPATADAIRRIAISTAAAGATTIALKAVVGRSRPSEAPDDSDDARPFSGHTSFPSGHTALAFALARSLDRETDARWIPAVAYPVAALVGWSRVRSESHWTSDVVVGAALGMWTADKMETLARHRWASRRLGFEIAPRPGGPCPALVLRY